MESIEFKACELELKSASDDDPGTLEGYAAVFGNVDRANESIVKGAFSATLPEFLTAGFLAVEHDWKQDIGTIDEATEDDKGLLVRATFYDTPDAQLVRRKLAAKVARSRRPGMSIGYRVLKDRKEKGVRYLTAIELLECSVVSVPCNISASVSHVKSLAPTDDDYARAARMRRLIIDSQIARHAPKGILHQ